jgi:hypothetical protein
VHPVLTFGLLARGFFDDDSPDAGFILLQIDLIERRKIGKTKKARKERNDIWRKMSNKNVSTYENAIWLCSAILKLTLAIIYREDFKMLHKIEEPSGGFAKVDLGLVRTTAPIRIAETLLQPPSLAGIRALAQDSAAVLLM